MRKTTRLSTAWTSHLKTKAEKLAFEQLIINNFTPLVLEKLEDILAKQIETLDRRETSLEQYDASNSWSHKQAHMNGYRQAVQQIMDLFQGLK